MRMWNIKPEIMCNKHLLGEHYELHMFIGCINKSKNLNGYLNKGLLETHNLRKRHKEIAKEMKRRGFNHFSALSYYKIKKLGKINKKKNLRELRERCLDCKNILNKNERR